MPEYKILLGALASVITLVAYVPYLVDIFRRRTKPHIFTWLVWGVLMFVGFAAQSIKGAGAGGWATAAEGIAGILVFLLSFSYGEKHIDRIDWLSLIGALCGVLLWIVTDNPLWAVVLVIAVDCCGFVPTFRKAFTKPHEETSASYLLVCVGFIFALFALESYSVTTWLYPAYLILANGGFWGYLQIRRMQTLSIRG